MSTLRLDAQARGRVQVACDVLNKEIEEESRKVRFVRIAVISVGLVLLALYVEQWRFIVAGAYIVDLVFSSNAKKRIAKTYKTLVVGRVVKALGRGLTYSRTSSLTLNDFKAMNLFSDTPTIFRSEDEVSGAKQNVSYSVHEISASRKQGKHTRIIFNGLMIRLEFNKNFHGHTVVVPEGEGGVLGGLLTDLFAASPRLKKKLVVLENPDFEKLFAVYSTDDQEARYLLTPKLMELVLEANALFEAQIRLAFVRNSLYVAVPAKGNRLEAGLNQTVTPESALGELVEVITLAENLIDTLQLETRIWSRA